MYKILQIKNLIIFEKNLQIINSCVYNEFTTIAATVYNIKEK